MSDSSSSLDDEASVLEAMLTCPLTTLLRDRWASAVPNPDPSVVAETFLPSPTELRGAPCTHLYLMTPGRTPRSPSTLPIEYLLDCIATVPRGPRPAFREVHFGVAGSPCRVVAWRPDSTGSWFYMRNVALVYDVDDYTTVTEIQQWMCEQHAQYFAMARFLAIGMRRAESTATCAIQQTPAATTMGSYCSRVGLPHLLLTEPFEGDEDVVALRGVLARIGLRAHVPEPLGPDAGGQTMERLKNETGRCAVS